MHRFWAVCFGLVMGLRAFGASTPEWIWGSGPVGDQDQRYFRKKIVVPANLGRILVTLAVDNQGELKIDGQTAVQNDEWSVPTKKAFPPKLSPGEHDIEVIAKNEGGAAGVLVRLEMIKADGSRETIISDASWQTSEDGKSGWVAARSLGKLGVDPWGEVALDPAPTPPPTLTALAGFQVDLVRTAEPGEGSWVCLAVDPKGRLIISPQGNEPMRRLTLDGAGKVVQVEAIKVPVSGAMGLLCAFNALYVNGQGPQGYHLYKITDSDGDDQYDKVELIRRWKSSGNDGGPGEHGAHGIVKGPDDHLYTVVGNFVDVPEDLAPSSPVRNYADDLVLPRMEDGNGFGAGRKPPGGYVLRMTPDGQHAELFAAGERNTYDIGFNRDGELFGYDSDMEWDWGMPWYRPTRIFHAVNGGDQGFREGSAKWPEYYADSLPAVVNIGIGSPTGVRFGTGAKVPDRYQRALYGLDWSYGRIVVVHLQPQGASYTGKVETLVKGKPLNVTDFQVGPDGAFYFTVGGRGTKSALYRVSYVGNESTEAHDVAIAVFTPEQAARAERRRLEAMQNPSAPGKVDDVWASLGHTDRHVRYAARVALEAIPVAAWKDRALAETNATSGLTALLALARYGGAEDQVPLLKAIGRWPLAGLPPTDYLTKLRVIEVSFARHGIPDEMRPRALEKLGAQFPSDDPAKNRELVQILVALDSPDVVSKALALRDAATTQEEQIIYQVALRKAKSGWTPELRQRYFAWFTAPPGGGGLGKRSGEHPLEFTQWFEDVGLKPGNGASFDKFLANMRQEAFLNVPDAEKAAVAAVLTKPAKPVAAPAPQRKVVQEWKTADLVDSLSELGRGRDYAKGKAVYEQAQCAVCHRFHGEGGAVGPDLTGVGTRFAPVDVLKSLTEPSAVISEQYQAVTLTLKDDTTVWGREVGATPEFIEILVDPLQGKTTRVPKAQIKERAVSKISPMPEGLINTFTKAEILELLAYLQADGNPKAAAFSK